MNDEVLQEKESGGKGIGYVGNHLSKKQVKIMLAYAKTSEERKVLLSLMPKPQKRY